MAWSSPPRAGWCARGRIAGIEDDGPEHLRKACEASLKRLRLEQIPLYQLHKTDPKVPLGESVRALAELQAEGKIRHIGISTVKQDQLLEAQRAALIVSVQNRYSAVDRSSQSILDPRTAQGLAFIAWAPVLQTGANSAVAAIAGQRGVSHHQVALAWLLAMSPAACSLSPAPRRLPTSKTTSRQRYLNSLPRRPWLSPRACYAVHFPLRERCCEGIPQVWKLVT